jgi:DNA-binding MarR family transcriptional regulator
MQNHVYTCNDLAGQGGGWYHDAMSRRGVIRTTGPDPDRLSPCVCSTLRMVTRAVTQLYDDVLRPSGLRVTQFSILATLARLGEANLRQLEDALAVDQTTLTRSLNLLERDGVIERVPHPDGRIKAMRPTTKGRRVLEVARPLWAQAQGLVLRELGTRPWADAKRRLAHLLDVAVESRGRRRGQPSNAPGRGRRRPS